MPRTPTPMLDKARDEILNSEEIAAALRELHSLTPDSVRPALHFAPGTSFGPAAVVYPGTLYAHEGATIEDALIAAHAHTLRLVEMGGEAV